MRKLLPEEIECRVAQVSAKGCSLLLYKTARVDRAILDETFGQMNWQNDFKLIDGKMYGGIGVYDAKSLQWIWKWDCGTESNTEAEKGQASDAFKRAGFKWGIGVELYTAPFIWYNGETVKDEYATKKAGKDVYKLANRFIKFFVKNIGYDEAGNINALTIIDDDGKDVFKLGKKAEKPKAKLTKDDLQIYTTLYKIDDVEAIKSYYELNKEEVNDREHFHNECENQIKAVKKIKATIPEGELI